MANLTERKNLRKQVLHSHYELSNGDSMQPVMRTIVATKIGLGEGKYNDPELMAAIKYLQDKGFLKICTNMEDTITNSGIDEVEAGFPNLPGTLKSADAESPIVEEMNTLIQKMRAADEVCKQGLLESIPFSELHDEVEREMARLTQSLDEIWRLKVKRATREWRNVPKPGFVANSDAAAKTFTPWIDLITEIIESITGEKPRIVESYISSGTPYTARKMLRGILAQAKEEIVLIDSYLHADMISVVEALLQGNPGLKLKFLTSSMPSNRNLTGFRSDYLLFKQQYSSANIEAKTNRDRDFHGRFLIIDGHTVYHSGHSFHDLGKRGDHVGQMDDPTSASSLLRDFRSWWDAGVSMDV